MTHDVHEVGRIAAVEHAEARVEPERERVLADQAVADRVERARPRQAQVVGHPRMRLGLRGQRIGHHALRAPRHLERRATREGQQQHAFRRHAGEQQVRDAMRQRAGLAGAGARDDEQRPGLDAAGEALRRG